MFLDTFVLLAADGEAVSGLAKLNNRLNLGDIIVTVIFFTITYASSEEVCMGTTDGHHGSTC